MVSKPLAFVHNVIAPGDAIGVRPDGYGDQGDWPENRSFWARRVVYVRSRTFEVGLAAVCAVGAVWNFVMRQPVAGSLLGFLTAFFALNVAARPQQLLRSNVREANAVVVGLPPRWRLDSMAFFAVPALAAVVAGRISGRMGWAGGLFILGLASAFVPIVALAAGERFLVSVDALERVPCWGRRRSTRLPWNAVRDLKCTTRYITYESRDEIRGFYLLGRTANQWCTEIFVPEHLDGIGDFADAALSRVAADVLAKDPAGRARLQELAGREVEGG